MDTQISTSWGCGMPQFKNKWSQNVWYLHSCSWSYNIKNHFLKGLISLILGVIRFILMHSAHGTNLGLYCTYSMFLKNCCISLHRGTSISTVTPSKYSAIPFPCPHTASSAYASPVYSSSWKSFYTLSLFLFTLFLFPRFVSHHVIFQCSDEFGLGELFSCTTLIFYLEFDVCQ